MRDRSIDLIKGIAILFVYLGHGILYHPIQMEAMYAWCRVLGRFIESFNMPLFFIVSGYLFSLTKKDTWDLYRGKVQRLLIPYLFTMAILIGVKLVLPSSLSYNSAVEGGVKSMILNALVYGGDRWFVYVMFVMFVLIIPFRSCLKKRIVLYVTIIALIVIYYLAFLPKEFKIKDVFYFMYFFLIGFALRDNWEQLKGFCRKYWFVIFILFIVANIVFVIPFERITFIYRFMLPLTGSLACMTIAVLLEKHDSIFVRYFTYCGKYSLQFYLFSFGYPIIRWLVVSYFQFSNPLLILLSVFVLQLITIAIIVEITRRIKFLKIPCGY